MSRVQDFQARVQAHIDAIWVDEPRDIYLLKKGYAPSGAGIHNQFFTTTVMLSGEVRALGIQVFPRLLAFCKSGKFSVEQMQYMADEFVRLDCGVMAYFGLRDFGDFLVEFRALLPEVDSLAQMESLLGDMFTMANRYQIWMHQIFPWYLSVHFPKLDPKELAQLQDIIAQEEANPRPSH